MEVFAAIRVSILSFHCRIEGNQKLCDGEQLHICAKVSRRGQLAL